MKLEIRFFEESFIEEQVNIGKSVLSTWKMASQTPVDGLKVFYSEDGFDPKTRLYAFREDKMVGFLTSAVQKTENEQPLTASLEFPIVLPNEKEATDLLFTRAIEILKEKGVKKINTRAGKIWGNTLELCKKYEYTKGTTLAKMGTINPQKAKNDYIFSNVHAFNLETDFDAMIDLFKEYYNLSDEQVDGIKIQLQDLAKYVGKIIAQNIIKEEEKIVARQLIYSPANQTDDIYLGTPLVRGDNKRETIKRLVAKNLAVLKEQGITKAVFPLFGKALENEMEFTKLGFEFSESLTLYSKEI